MMFRTHLIFAFLIGLVFLDFSNINKYLFLILVLISGIIPDIDYPKSKIGRKFWIISKPLNFLFGHRNFLHSLFFVFLICMLIYLFFKEYWIPVFIGYCSHIFLDCLTKRGIFVFYPFKFKIKGFIETGKLFESLLFFILIFLTLIKFINLGVLIF